MGKYAKAPLFVLLTRREAWQNERREREKKTIVYFGASLISPLKRPLTSQTEKGKMSRKPASQTNRRRNKAELSKGRGSKRKVRKMYALR